MHTFPNYNHWRNAITGACGLTLTASYCRERIAALGDSTNSSTRSFEETYGESYLAQVISWFQEAEREARK
ncbi:hypothetical protein [Luteolibacter sp. AS25]|uniref:hypothetical protein n=1 Tax=Luteolibacter sp. AS25 TaxID=3135776 RepID=UPI00398A88E6